VIDPVVNGVARFGVWISVFAANFDRFIIDGVVNGSAWLATVFGNLLRNTQDGRVQVYLLVATVAVMVWLLLQAMPVLLTLV